MTGEERQKDFQKVVKMAQDRIIDFLEDYSDSETLKKARAAFAKYPVVLSDAADSKSELTGKTDVSAGKAEQDKITIDGNQFVSSSTNNHHELDDLIGTIIHEYAHEFRRDSGTNYQKSFEESAASVFSEMCINHANAKSIGSAAELFESRDIFDYRYSQNELRAILYVLKKHKLDITLLTKYVFGDELDFVNKCCELFGDKFLDYFNEATGKETFNKDTSKSQEMLDDMFKDYISKNKLSYEDYFANKNATTNLYAPSSSVIVKGIAESGDKVLLDNEKKLYDDFAYANKVNIDSVNNYNSDIRNMIIRNIDSKYTLKGKNSDQIYDTLIDLCTDYNTYRNRTDDEARIFTSEIRARIPNIDELSLNFRTSRVNGVRAEFLAGIPSAEISYNVIGDRLRTYAPGSVNVRVGGTATATTRVNQPAGATIRQSVSAPAGAAVNVTKNTTISGARGAQGVVKGSVSGTVETSVPSGGRATRNVTTDTTTTNDVNVSSETTSTTYVDTETTTRERVSSTPYSTVTETRTSSSPGVVETSTVAGSGVAVAPQTTFTTAAPTRGESSQGVTGQDRPYQSERGRVNQPEDSGAPEVQEIQDGQESIPQEQQGYNEPVSEEGTQPSESQNEMQPQEDVNPNEELSADDKQPSEDVNQQNETNQEQDENIDHQKQGEGEQTPEGEEKPEQQGDEPNKGKNEKENPDEESDNFNEANNRNNHNQRINNSNNNPDEEGTTNYRKNSNFNQRRNNDAPSLEDAENAAENAKKGADAAKKGSEAAKGAEAAKRGADAAKKAETAKKGAEAAKTAEAAGSAASKKGIGSFIAAYPWVVAIIVVVIILILIILTVLLTFELDAELKAISDNLANSNSENVIETKYDCADSEEDDDGYTISLVDTPLSRSEFIEKLESYQSGYKSFEVLKQNAGLVYDLGVKNGINPEMAVIRAEKEGYSPGTSYNYWGIVCYNGASTCTGHYNSLESGLNAFYSTIKSYNTTSLFKAMDNWAYIGDVWYAEKCHVNNNKYCSDVGGCYYLEYIKEFLSDADYSRYKHSCEISTCNERKEGNCPESDRNAQIAYTKWQVSDSIKFREKIFNLGPDGSVDCEELAVNLNDGATNTNEAPIMSNGQTVEQLLISHSNSPKQFNDELRDIVIKDGVGTRKAVVDAALFLINTFETYHTRIPYSYGGGWGESGWYANNYNVDTYYGINPLMGQSINGNKGYTQKFSNGSSTTYYYLGLDCSGFVTWALRNGGLNINLTTADLYKNYGVTYDATSTAKYIGQPGDVLSSEGHIVLIIKYNEEDKSYTVAEAGGVNNGLLVQKRYLSDLKNYKLVDLSSKYEKNVNTNYIADFNNGRKV